VTDTIVRSILRLPSDVHAPLAAWAKEEDRSLNNLIVRLLRHAVAERDAHSPVTGTVTHTVR
jgi:hypothetical protein